MKYQHRIYFWFKVTQFFYFFGNVFCTLTERCEQRMQRLKELQATWRKGQYE